MIGALFPWQTLSCIFQWLQEFLALWLSMNFSPSSEAETAWHTAVIITSVCEQNERQEEKLKPELLWFYC